MTDYIFNIGDIIKHEDTNITITNRYIKNILIEDIKKEIILKIKNIMNIIVMYVGLMVNQMKVY